MGSPGKRKDNGNEGGRSPTRAIVLPAAVVRSITLRLEASAFGLADRLRGELDGPRPSFAGMDDANLATLLVALELELQERGWIPRREWKRRAEEAGPA